MVSPFVARRAAAAGVKSGDCQLPFSPVLSLPFVATTKKLVVELKAFVAVVALPAERFQRQRLARESIRGVREMLADSVIEPEMADRAVGVPRLHARAQGWRFQ